MSKCSVCGELHSLFILNNKRVCMKCDELLFDMEIEVDEESSKTQPEITAPKKPTITVGPVSKK